MALLVLLLLMLSTALSFSPSSQAVLCSAQPQQKQGHSNNLRHKQGVPVLRHKHSTPLFAATFSSTSGTCTASPRNANAVLDWASKLVPAVVSPNTSSRQQQQQQQQQQHKTHAPQEADYQRRKEEWANRYTNLDSLRDTFGANRNKVWGDLDAATARRLYKTLLPSALLELVKMGVQPQDLAPLAYSARVAAKLYARERCQVPSRVGAQLFDGFRQFKRYGKFQTAGMSYDQVWEKYHKVIMDDCCADSNGNGKDCDDCPGLTEQDVTAKICLKILERSCVSNENVDRWVLTPNDNQQKQDLQHITKKLEKDVRKLLLPVALAEPNETPKALTIQRYKLLRILARARKRRRLGKPPYRVAHKATRAATAAQCSDYNSNPNNMEEEEEDNEMATTTSSSSSKRSWRPKRRTATRPSSE
jgi:hypothetical protein